jgi:uncharacterized protein
VTAVLSELIQVILKDYQLPISGHHGVAHWARVLENGLALAPRTGANDEVVRLFALLHDSRRMNEAVDHLHGKRGAEFAATLRGTRIDLPDADFELLYQACALHTDGLTTAEVTVQTCWDADRLDLARVFIQPQAKFLCTEAAREPDFMRWAVDRGAQRVVPALVAEEWHIQLPPPTYQAEHGPGY